MSSNNLTIKKIKQEIKANEEEKLAEEEKKKQALDWLKQMQVDSQ